MSQLIISALIFRAGLCYNGNNVQGLSDAFPSFLFLCSVSGVFVASAPFLDASERNVSPPPIPFFWNLVNATMNGVSCAGPPYLVARWMSLFSFGHSLRFPAEQHPKVSVR